MSGRAWTVDETDTLRDGLGRQSLAQLGAELGRSEEAVRVRTKRLRLSQRAATLNQRQVGRLCDVDSQTVARWIRRGLLAATRSPVRMGSHALWAVELEAFERFLRAHPGWYDPARIQEEPWRSIARAAVTDPLLSPTAAAAALGVSYPTVLRHLRRGWLRGERAQTSGHRGTWLLRRSALAEFRPRHPVGAVGLRSVAGRNARAGRRRPSTTPLGWTPVALLRPTAASPRQRPPSFRPVVWREDA